MSLPSWERGLKSTIGQSSKLILVVAPLVGAWIEIRAPVGCVVAVRVAPLVGAWIEIILLRP